MSKFNAIFKAIALTIFVLAAHTVQASESNNEEVLIPVTNPNTGKVEYLTCPTYPACDLDLLDSTTKDKKEKDKD